MIVFEIPCHRMDKLAFLCGTARQCKSPLIKFAIATNGREMDRSDCHIQTENLVAEYIPNIITEPWVSMVELRANANKVATKYFNSECRIMADHNFVFRDGWEDFIIEAVNDMHKFSYLIKRPCYMGMGGTLGSYGHGRRAFMGPQPLFPCGRGIIYTMPYVWEFMQKLPCAAEEQYLCSVLFKRGHVPLRKMMSPIHHTMNTNRGILNKINADIYNPEIIRQIWKDPSWMFKPSYSSREKPPYGRYYAHCPKNAMKEWSFLKTELLRFPRVYEEFAMVDYKIPKLKGKDLFI
jgi:hypothetical protein